MANPYGEQVVESWSGRLGEIRAASTAGGGTALNTTAAFIQIPDGTRHLTLLGRNFSTAVVVQYALNPYLLVVKTTDSLDTVSDYSKNAQDASTSTKVTLDSLGTAANGDFLLVGSHLPFRGVNVDVANANANAATLAVYYWNGTAWADGSATDGTASGGATFAVDGNVTWSVPTAWKRASLVEIATPAPTATLLGTAFHQRANMPLYWTRWEVSAALDSTTDLNSMLAMAQSTAYAEWTSGLPLELGTFKGVGGHGCVEAKVDAGTGNLIVNCASRASGQFG